MNQKQRQLLKEEIKKIIRNEVFGRNMVGLHELVTFYNTCKDNSLINKVDYLLKTGQNSTAWELIRSFLQTTNQMITMKEGLKSWMAAGLLGAATLTGMGATTPKVQSHNPAITAPAIKTDKAIDIIAATLVGEAGGEGREGMQAVMNVIMNRAKGDITKAPKVCLKHKQFSMWNGKQVNDIVPSAKKHKKWNEAVELVNMAKAGKLNDITGGADFYYNPKLAKPDWAKIFTKTTTIGNHIFYKHGKENVSSFY